MSTAQAQSVHKCVINGNAVYQAAACPPANDEKSLVIPAPPSQQELLDATANGRLQNYRTSSGGIATPAQRRYNGRNPPVLPTLTPSQQEAQETPRNSCEALNQTFREDQYRRAELSAPGQGATRADALQRVNDDLKRIADQANTAHCQLR